MLGSGPGADGSFSYLPSTSYPPPGGYMQPPRRDSNSRAMWAHLGALLTWLAGLIIFAPLSLFCFIVPLILRSSHPHDPFIRHHATQALNSTLTGLIIWVPAVVLIFLAIFSPVGIAGALLVGIAALGLSLARLVCGIIGAVKAHNGQPYQYPIWVAFRLVKDDSLSGASMIRANQMGA